MRSWIADYVAGCCRSANKNKKYHPPHAHPHYTASPPRKDTLPFQQIALDLITGLPPNGPYDSVLTIVDHGCSRAAVFLPCATTITGPGVAQLYFDNVLPMVWDYRRRSSRTEIPVFTSHFGRALANKIGAKQKPVDCIPPSDRWALRTEEPMGRTISTPHCECTTGGTGVDGSRWRQR